VLRSVVVRVAGLLTALLALVVLPASASAAPDFAGVDEAMRDAITSGEIPGVVVLVGRSGEVLYHRALGWRALVPEPATMARDTVFDIASLTKPLGTTLAVMSLVERGKITLNAPLGSYLREFKGHAFEHVTIRRLLTHSAGFPAIPANGSLAGGFPRAARTLARKSLEYPPGSGFQYSDTGFILLGEVVRRVSGQALDRYLDRTLFRPLGLRDTAFVPGKRLHGRIAPTEYHNGALLQGVVHDPRARLLDGVAGHAGMFSTASDLARLCRMLVQGGELEGRRILKASTVQLMWQPDGDGGRALGWDIASGYARPMAPFFPPGSVGHTGFTGTSVWIDPPSRTYMIVLTNRVHPNGGGASRIRELRSRVAAAVGAALFTGATASATRGGAADGDEVPAPVPVAPAAQRSATIPGTATDVRVVVPAPAAVRAPVVRTGLDQVVASGFSQFLGHTVGLVTNQTGIDGQGRRAIDLFASAAGLRLGAIFTPEHGLTGLVDADVPHGRDPVTGRTIWSLYGPTRRPSSEMLRGLSVIVFDIQDVGARYYTYLTTLMYVMEEAGRRSIPVVVLDRPNPINGRVIEGPVMDPDLRSFTAPHMLPVRTGLTMGEFGRLVAAERKIPVALTVIPLAGWDRSRWFDETGLPWANPSPNIRSVTQALLYSGIGLLEATNLSVGRGTESPFEVIGAPWLEPVGLADSLNRLGLPGVRFEPVQFTPSENVYARTPCGGIRFQVTDREAIRPVTVALAVARMLRARHRDQFRPEGIQNLLVHRPTMWAFLRGDSLDRVLSWAETDRVSFLNRRASYLLY
jgi:uncharacterized protein YbbC (DUF1343 family)/CubicO group peptidase (beta-lactamase class C family)